MNRSGDAIRELVRSFGKKLSLNHDLILFHDDIDIPFGKIKIDKNASAAGHKGVQNIIDQLKTKDLIRFRIGIRPSTDMGIPTDELVLKKFSKIDQDVLERIYTAAYDAFLMLCESGIQKAQTQANNK